MLPCYNNQNFDTNTNWQARVTYFYEMFLSHFCTPHFFTLHSTYFSNTVKFEKLFYYNCYFQHLAFSHFFGDCVAWHNAPPNATFLPNIGATFDYEKLLFISPALQNIFPICLIFSKKKKKNTNYKTLLKSLKFSVS